ncbi:ATP-binding cassette domain-containing protein [Microbacterium sp. 2FI]|uniref:ATP-binding cassette domain-containing protein n=1 Tax=Microbacterium sp. 2FI TaxID=2502193 RepID=UPI0010F4A445|nr:ATP-binding cassette domain-containing protein [Microbacterium sp. 2FI]
MTFRPGPLRAAAVLAAGFVVVRVVYRVLFHGAEGSGAVLLPFPEFRLPAPFAHVVLLGPVTIDGLWDAASSAIPIAATILAFGLLSALIDLHRVFARASRRGPLRGIARALAIAWATLPSLAEAAHAVRRAQRLRGERGGVRLLAPLLQRTLERAGRVASALELRGFAGRPLDGDCLRPVEATDVEVGFGAGSAGASGSSSRTPHGGIRLPSLTLGHGTLAVLSGPTGSGKSTVLRALAGLHTHVDGGWQRGTLRIAGHDRAAVPPRDLALRVGVVLQHPREAFTAERVRDEIGLTLELRGVAAVIVAARVAEVADRVGVAGLLDRPTRGLSAGEATRVAIAAAIVEHPILLLVDEPLADLDADARAQVTCLLDALAHEAGMCVVVAEHRVEQLAARADVRLRIVGGEVGIDDGRASEVDRVGESPPTVDAARRPPAVGDIALSAAEVTVSHRGHIAVTDASLSVAAGEFVALVGPNGAGKSSLLVTLALPGRDTRVEAAGRVALVPDASDDLFVFDTVAAECLRADRRARKALGGGDDATTADRFARFLGFAPDGPELVARWMRHPLDLSVGERRCLALAIQLAGSPAVLLVDEPTRGLDPDARALVIAALQSLAADGTAVLVASHEPEIAGLADRALAMRDGVLGADASNPLGQRAGVSAARGQRSRVFTTPDTRHPPARKPLVGAGGSRIHPELRTSAGGRLVSLHTADRRGYGPVLALLAANLIALAAFCWPLVASAVPEQAHDAVPIAALALAPLAVLVVVASLDGTVRSAHMLALLGTLAAIGAAVRIASTGVGGLEAVFILLILAGRSFGARFGLLLGMLTIALSTLVTGTFGPWTPFQMFACAWVGAGAGLLPRRVGLRAEIVMLSVYGVLASYAFGLIMNLWFWPFAVGGGTGISYVAGAPAGQNVASFLLYSLVTSTATWDTLRAITTVIGLALVGRAILAALRRAKPVVPQHRSSAAETTQSAVATR